VSPVKLCLTRLSLFKITPLFKYHKNTFILVALRLRLPLLLHKRDTLSLIARVETELRTSNRCYCTVLYHPCLGSLTHGNRESRPPKPTLFVSSSARVKTDNQVFRECLPHDCSIDPQFPLLPSNGRTTCVW